MRVQLFATLSAVARQGSSVHGILQVSKLEWVVISSSRGSSDPGITHYTNWILTAALWGEICLVLILQMGVTRQKESVSYLSGV